MNYYWISDTERRHIGYTRPGEMFALHVYPDEGIVGLADWQERWSRPHTRIEDENGNELSDFDMRQVLGEGQSGPIEEEPYLYSIVNSFAPKSTSDSLDFGASFSSVYGPSVR